jgi:hypothetical protein
METFWQTFGEALRRDNSSFHVPTIRSASEFQVGLSRSGSLKKPVVLVVDEFDLLYGAAPDEVQDSVLNVLRWLRQEREGTWLHSFVALGPFSVLELVGKRGCPFDLIESPPLTAEQVTDLFDQFAREKKLNLDKRVVRDVYARTEGHAGCVGFCGKEIDETLLRRKGTLYSYEEWVQYATLELDNRLGIWPTMQRLLNELSLPESMRTSAKEKERIPHVVEARKQLCSVYMATGQAVGWDSERDMRYARYLAAEGALSPVDGGVAFKMRPPLIRSLLINKILPLTRHLCPIDSVPLDNSGMLIMDKAVEMAFVF